MHATSFNIHGHANTGTEGKHNTTWHLQARPKVTAQTAN